MYYHSTNSTIGGTKTYKRILVSLDGSKLAELALIYVKELVGRLNAGVTLLHVIGQRNQHWLQCIESMSFWPGLSSEVEPI